MKKFVSIILLLSLCFVSVFPRRGRRGRRGRSGRSHHRHYHRRGGFFRGRDAALGAFGGLAIGSMIAASAASSGDDSSLNDRINGLRSNVITLQKSIIDLSDKITRLLNNVKDKIEKIENRIELLEDKV